MRRGLAGKRAWLPLQMWGEGWWWVRTVYSWNCKSARYWTPEQPGGERGRRWYLIGRKQHLYGPYRVAWQHENCLPY